MDAAALQAWWWTRQGLDGSLQGKSPEQVLTQSGWARSLGGVGPYLTLFARAGTTREDADAAVASLRIHELPSARGCTYVMPALDFALGLKVGENVGDDLKTIAKLGVPEAEIRKLSDVILRVLENGPLDTEGLREAAAPAVRNLGPEGSKKGVTTTLPVALGELRSVGDIRRVPINGRLDQQRYRYTLWKPNPLAKSKLSSEQAYTELARRFFSWIGPASMADFQSFSALGVKAAKAAVEPLKLVPLEPGDQRLMLPEDREELQSFKPPKEPQYALVSSLDAFSILRREVPASHAILDRGQLIGLWEFDQPAGKIVWQSHVKKTKPLEQAVRRTEEYVHSQLGDARSFSLDSPKSRIPKIEALRKAEGVN